VAIVQARRQTPGRSGMERQHVWVVCVMALSILALDIVSSARLRDQSDVFNLSDEPELLQEGAGDVVEEDGGCGVFGCNAGFWLTSPSSASCECNACDVCDANKFKSGGCNHTSSNPSTNTVCSICKQCEATEFMKTACGGTTDTVCQKCTSCCPTDAAGENDPVCKKETVACSAEADATCAMPTDFVGKVTTGMADSACGVQCGSDVADDYISNSTWNFIIKDVNDQLIFQGQPKKEVPCSTVSCAGAVSLDTEPGTSNGKVPRKLTIVPADGGTDSWCMASFCISSASAGVKFEFAPTQSKWMNPGETGQCGGQSQEWTVDLSGPIAGQC